MKDKGVKINSTDKTIVDDILKNTPEFNMRT